MKIAVSSKGAGLGAWLEPDLANCGFLMIVDEKFKFTAIENISNINDLIEEALDEGIQAFVTGYLEDDAIKLLKNNDVQIYYAQQGSIMEIVEQIIDENLSTIDKQ